MQRGDNINEREIPEHPRYPQPYNLPLIYSDNPALDWHLRLKVHGELKYHAKKSTSEKLD